MADGVLYVDGASLGNPGDGGAGVVLKDGEGRLIFKCGEYLGRVTNNQAEYKALIRGLEETKRRGWKDVLILTDSLLVTKQLEGAYKVRSEQLRQLHRRVQRLLKDFSSWRIKHIPREENREADRMAKEAAGRSGSGGRWPLWGPEESPSSRGQDGR